MPVDLQAGRAPILWMDTALYPLSDAILSLCGRVEGQGKEGEEVGKGGWRGGSRKREGNRRPRVFLPSASCRAGSDGPCGELSITLSGLRHSARSGAAGVSRT